MQWSHITMYLCYADFQPDADYQGGDGGGRGGGGVISPWGGANQQLISNYYLKVTMAN